MLEPVRHDDVEGAVAVGVLARQQHALRRLYELDRGLQDERAHIAVLASWPRPVCVVQTLELRAKLAVPFAFGPSRLHEAPGQLALVVQRLLGASQRALETRDFRALAFGLFLRLLADRLDLAAGLLSQLLLPGVVLRRGRAEGVGVGLGGGPPRSSARQVVPGVGERRFGVGTPARRATPGVERRTGAEHQRQESNEGRPFD